MRCFTWKGGRLSEGIALTTDPRLGPVVFLGEEGRGRRYEKVALGRGNPPPVVDGKVMSVETRKITVPARDGKPERAFFVLEKSASEAGVLVRVNTLTSYVRGGSGRWRVNAGKPEVIVSGYGAFGDAGRIGNWDDGLVAMRPGDVLKVMPSRELGGVDSFALWVDESGLPQTATWGEYENIKALAEVEALVADTKAGDGIEAEIGTMPCYTYVGSGSFQSGIKVGRGVTGPAIILGEEGRGRKKAEVAFVGFTPEEELHFAAVAKLSETVLRRESWETPKTKVIWGLTASECFEDGAFLIRVKPPMGNRIHREVKVNRGNPVCLAAGVFAEGMAGNVGSTPDELWVLRTGDSLVVGTYSNPGWVLENVGGEILAQPTEEWEAADARINPEVYLAKGKVPFGGSVPAEWVGRVVSIHRFRKDNGSMWLDQSYEGELISASSGRVELNLGWNGRDRRMITVENGLWIRLEADKMVVRAEAERETAKAEVAELQGAAVAVRKAEHFKCFDSGLQAQISKVADGKESSDWSANSVQFSAIATEEIQRWVSWAKDVLSKATEVEAAAKEAAGRQTRGEVFMNFRAWKRRGGTNSGQGWVVRADGSLRERDRMPDRHRRYDEGHEEWDLVCEDELALRWSKAYAAADHQFEVVKRPVGGLTRAQLETVARLERDLADDYDGQTGFSSGIESPHVGNGWGLKPKPEPKPAAPQDSSPVDLSKVDLGSLFGGGARDTRRK